MPFGGLLTTGLLSAGTSIFGGLMGKHAASTAAQQQADAGGKAIDFEKSVYDQELQNFSDYKSAQQPYLNLGSTSIAQLMKGIGDGTFGSTADFKAPTLEEARATPGYQFAQEQGSKGILQAQAAFGGAGGGGTAKALQGFETNLADSTYNSVFNRNLQTYQTNLQKNAQDFSELFQPAQLGEGALNNIGQLGSTVGQGPAAHISDLFTQVGNANAAGTIGGNNALTGGFTGAATGISDAVLLGQLMRRTKAGGGAAAPA